MKSYIIEFRGELSDKCKKSYFKKLRNFLYLFSLISLSIISAPLIIMGIKFGFLYYILFFLIIVLVVCLVTPIALEKESWNKTFPVKIIIENDEIAAINSEQASKLDFDANGIESLCVDGSFITNIKSISEVRKIVDFGEWYYIFFSSKYVVTDCICQKDLINKGSIEEFEKLFEGQIERHY